MRQLREFDELKGYCLRAHDGEIGTIREIYFDEQDWVVRYFVVRTGNWLSGRKVLISPRSVSGVDENERRLVVDLSRDKVRESPPVDTEKPVSRHYEEAFFQHYGWERYWIDGKLLGPAGPGDEAGQAPSRLPPQPENPHLRGSGEVRGYRIHALDGEIGQVSGFILDDKTWQLRYLVVDTGRFLPGKKVLVSPAWVRELRWADRELVADLERAAIETAPPYDGVELITPDYELQLYTHYGRLDSADEESAAGH